MRSPDGFFDSELIARLSRLEITAKRMVDGFLAGRNRSVRHGVSVEFVEHREYVPGDDLRHLDWKVLGRMDRYYVKRYEEETNITVLFLVDSSASMTYGSQGYSKFEQAAYVAASLSYLLNRQRDSVGLAFFDTAVRNFVPPSAKRIILSTIAQKLIGTTPEGKSTLDDILQAVSYDLPRRCLFILLSDFFVSRESIRGAIKFLEHRGHDAIVLQVLDRAEREFPFRANTLFRGLEDRRELLVEPFRLKERYLKLLDEFVDFMRVTCESSGFDYQLLIGGESLPQALATLLAARARRKPVVRRGAQK